MSDLKVSEGQDLVNPAIYCRSQILKKILTVLEKLRGRTDGWADLLNSFIIKTVMLNNEAMNEKVRSLLFV